MALSSAKQQAWWTTIPQSSTVGRVASQVGALQNIANRNTAASAQQAAQLRDWQSKQYETMREFNAREAQKNRDWQERMSNTAHQREVKDLIAAGLNPVLSVTGGNGAAVTSGATASSGAPSGAMGSVDTSATGALAGLFGSLLSSLLSLEGTRVSAQSNQAIADKYTAMSQLTTAMNNATSRQVAHIGANATLNSATISAMASRYVADMHLEGTKYASDRSYAASVASSSIHAAAQKYGYDIGSMTEKEIAQFNAEVNKEMQKAGFKQEFDIKKEYPSNEWQALAPIMNDFNEGLHNSAKSIFAPVLDYGKWLWDISSLNPNRKPYYNPWKK